MLTVGIEPTTVRLQVGCSTGLSYVSIGILRSTLPETRHSPQDENKIFFLGNGVSFHLSPVKLSFRLILGKSDGKNTETSLDEVRGSDGVHGAQSPF